MEYEGASILNELLDSLLELLPDTTTATTAAATATTAAAAAAATAAAAAAASKSKKLTLEGVAPKMRFVVKDAYEFLHEQSVRGDTRPIIDAHVLRAPRRPRVEVFSGHVFEPRVLPMLATQVIRAERVLREWTESGDDTGGSSFWMGAHDTPRFALEQAVKRIAELDFPDGLDKAGSGRDR